MAESVYKLIDLVGTSSSLSAMIASVVFNRANFRRQIAKQADWSSGHNRATPSVTAATR